jgi:hypothetical protein
MKKNSVHYDRRRSRYADAVQRLTLAFLRVGNFFTGRAPGGAACGGVAPIVKMALPPLPDPDVGVSGVDAPNGAVGV